ncbi:MAG: hypothetical protein ACKVT2_03930 [Saprospiraceae bacterium]
MLTILIISISLNPSFSQNAPDKKWVVSLGFGIQAHDKRLFDFPPKEGLLARQSEIFGTYQFRINLLRVFNISSKVSLSSGIGLTNEIATFLRPFDQNYFTKAGTEELNHTDRYHKYLLQLPLIFEYRMFSKLSLTGEALPQVNLLTVSHHSLRDLNYSKFDPDYYSTEINVGVKYIFNRRINVGVNYRGFQFKKIDKVLFNYTLRDPRTDQTYETYNPFKLWLSIGYKF